MAVQSPLVFVFHPVVGVTRVPRDYMDAYEASGFRFATEAQVQRWYEEHDLVTGPYGRPPLAARVPSGDTRRPATGTQHDL